MGMKKDDFYILFIQLDGTCNPPLVLIYTCNKPLDLFDISSLPRTVTLSALEVVEDEYTLVESILLVKGKNE